MKRIAFFLIFACAALSAVEPTATQLVDLKKVFTSAPVIYTVLSLLSTASLAIWLYSLIGFRPKEFMPQDFLTEIRDLLTQNRFEDANTLCSARGGPLSSIIAAGLASRRFGPAVMIDAMKSEGKRVSTSFWQRLSLLNDIVIVAPMLGLLGTVIGMFYAFYDVNRSAESINALFDGLGIAVGTTVAGLIVAIVAMIFYTTLKYRIVHALSQIENEALALSPLIEPKGDAWN